MAAKGSSSGSCCCNSCETMPFSMELSILPIGGFANDQLISFKGHPTDLVQGFCCTCLPTNACITVECLATGVHTTAYLPLRCEALGTPPGVAGIYFGSVYISGEAHTAYFTLEVPDDLKCYICLEIPSLGFEKQCLELSQEHFQHPLMWCKSLTYSIDQYGLRWGTEFIGPTNIYNGVCSDIKVTMGVPSVQSITGRPTDWVDLYGEFAPQYEVGRRIIDENSIRNRCKGCGCISNIGCLTVFRVKDGTSDAYPMGLGCSNCNQPCPTGHIYSSYLGDYGPLVSIEPNSSADPRCVLALLQISNTEVFNPPLYGSVIKKGIGLDPNDCPFPQQRWEIYDADLQLTLVDFRTESCVTTPCTVNPGGCCTGIEMPSTLHCTISRQADYESALCECLPQTIPMLFDGAGINPAWTGRYATQPGDIGSWCDGAERDFKVRMYCAGATWIFEYGAGETYQPAPCSGTATSSPGSFSCRPVLFTFQHDGRCCGPSGFPDGYGGVVPAGPQTLTFTITE